MQTSSDFDVLNKVTFLVGDEGCVKNLPGVPSKVPFSEDIVDFLNDVSKGLLAEKSAKAFSDVITFAFWIRKASVLKLKERFSKQDGTICLGKGVVFHIAPSNVPVNFAFSLVAGLLTGNANVVRVPSKDFEQVSIIANAFNLALKDHEEIRPYIVMVRYERDKFINDLFSKIADMRVIWGGDETIAEVRKSPLPPRSGEITFADRYSLAVIDSDSYLDVENKKRVAEDFYNDTFFSDQNACTSPRIIIWTGNMKDDAKRIFWEEEHKIVKDRYSLQPVQSVNKLTSSYLIASTEPGCVICSREDNLIVRVSVPKITDLLIKYKDNSGYFLEYDCSDILEIAPLCDDKRCQTIAYLGEYSAILPLLKSGVKGIDRIVPIGKTMDFDLIWDGYDLPSLLTRVVFLS